MTREDIVWIKGCIKNKIQCNDCPKSKLWSEIDYWGDEQMYYCCEKLSDYAVERDKETFERK